MKHWCASCYAGRRQASDTSAEAGEISGNVQHARKLFWKDLWTFFSLKKSHLCVHEFRLIFAGSMPKFSSLFIVRSLRLKMCCYSVADVAHSVKYSWCAPLYLLDILISLDKFNHQNQCGVSCFCTFSPPLQTVFLALIQMWLYLQIVLAFMLGRIRPAFTLESLFFCIYWHLHSRSVVPLLDNRSHCNMKCPPSTCPHLTLQGWKICVVPVLDDLPHPFALPSYNFFFCAVYAQNLPFKYFFFLHIYHQSLHSNFIFLSSLLSISACFVAYLESLSLSLLLPNPPPT